MTLRDVPQKSYLIGIGNSLQSPDFAAMTSLGLREEDGYFTNLQGLSLSSIGATFLEAMLGSDVGIELSECSQNA